MPDSDTPFPLRVCLTPWSGGNLRLATDQIRIWGVPLGSPPVSPEALLLDLTLEERARAERYRMPKPRDQFVISRGLLRRILGAHLGVAPGDVPITYTGAGKPVLGDGVASIHFNVTHTDGLALIALAAYVIGVDVERIRHLPNPEGLVERFFSAAERTQYLALDEAMRLAGFFRGWTCKEALIKAAGLSVTYLDEFDVELNPEQPARLLAARHPGLAGREWSLAAWIPAPDHAAAIAVAGRWDLVVEGVG